MQVHSLMDFHKLHTPCNQHPDQETGHHQYPLSWAFTGADWGLWRWHVLPWELAPCGQGGPSTAPPPSQPLQRSSYQGQRRRCGSTQARTEGFIKCPDPEALQLARSEVSQLWRLTQPHTLPCQQAVCWSLEALLPRPFMGMICLYLFLIFTLHLGEVK